jgi:SAM-dependent methyltransferase
MKFLMLFLLSFNLLAAESDPVTHVFKKVVAAPKADCVQCEQNFEQQRTCPEFLGSLLESDKDGGMYGLRKSAYKECNKAGHSLDSIFTRLDYDKVEELERDIKNNLAGKVSAAVVNKLLQCKKEGTKLGAKQATPIDRRILLGKATYSLLKIEGAEKELYDQIAFADFINMEEPLKGLDCSDEVFSSMEAKCKNLKANCFKNKDAERNNFTILSEKAFTDLNKLETELGAKNISAEEKDRKSKARDMIKAKFPWIASKNFKKIFDNQKSKSFNLALHNSLKQDRDSSLKKLTEYKNSSHCFIESKGKACESDKFTTAINSAPELDLYAMNNFSNDQDHLKFNINMDAQSCLARYADNNNEATHLLNQGLRDAALISATAGLGALSGMAEAASLARSGSVLAENATLLARAAFVAQFSVDSYYGVSGVETAFDACTGHGVGKIQSTGKEDLACPMMDSKDGVSFNEQESCKLEVIMAVAGGLPVAAGLKTAGQLSHNMKLKEKLLKITKEFTEIKPVMIRDRDVGATLALFGHDPALKTMLEGKPIKIGTLGAGKGVSAEELANRGHQVTAVEFEGKTETIATHTAKGGSITRINGTDAATVPLEHKSFDLFYDTHGANAYTDRPDLVTQNIANALKKDGKYYAFGGGDGDNWALNNKIILENGNVVSYLDWIKTIPGLKVEAQIIPGKLDEAGHLISPGGSTFVITKVSEDVKIPELKNIYRETSPDAQGRMVPHQTFKVASAKAPAVTFPVTEGGHQHFVSQGLPTDQLKVLAAKGKGAELVIPEGPSSGGILDSTKIRLKSGVEVSLARYLEKVPGIQVSHSASVNAQRYIETRNGVKVFTGTQDEFKNNFRVTELVQVRDTKIKVTDPKALEAFCREHGLDLAGLGKPAAIKFDAAGNAVEQVRAPYFIEH